MTAYTLAWRTTTRYKARAVLAVTGVAIIGALNFDMILLSRGLLVSFASMLDAAGFNVRIVGSADLPISRLPVAGAAQLAEQLRGLREIEEVALVQLAPGIVLMGNRQQAVTLIGTSQPSARGAWTLVRGTDPFQEHHAGSPLPIVVAQRLAALLEIGPGSTVQLRARIPGTRSVLPTVTCRVAGLADFIFESTSEYSVAMTLEGLQLIQGGGTRDEADLVLVRANPEGGPDAALRAIAAARPDVRAFSNEQVVAEFNRNGFAYFRQISLVLSATTVVFTLLLVATLLTVSVNQRLGEVAALRALGIARRRVAATLVWESALLVGIGGVVALPVGGVLAFELDRVLRQMPGLPDRLHFFVFEPRALVLHVIVLAVTAIGAALYPIWIATHLPIAQTLRREVIS